jgi:Flp pilus assembly protein TadD
VLCAPRPGPVPASPAVHPAPLIHAAAAAAPTPQVGRSLTLLGRHRQAVEVYEEAQKLAGDDRELWQGRGCAHAQLPGGGDA